MNKLPLAKRVLILTMLCEGSSMLSISREAGVSINTVSKLLVEAGEACLALHNEMVRNVRAVRVRCDNIWSFCHAKDMNPDLSGAAQEGVGDVWTWTALDPETKLIISYFIGSRGAESAIALMEDLGSRLSRRFELTTDGQNVYADAVDNRIGGELDHAQVLKIYGPSTTRQGRYNAGISIDAKKNHVEGNRCYPNASTIYVERQNLTMRMWMPRFTRATSAFSKKLDIHIHALALYFGFYDFCRVDKTLRSSRAMAAGITGKLWSLADIVEQIDARARGPRRLG